MAGSYPRQGECRFHIPIVENLKLYYLACFVFDLLGLPNGNTQ